MANIGVFTITILLQVFIGCWSEVTVSVKFVSYENPTGLDLTGNKCDRFGPCDPRFSICLDTYLSDTSDQSSCAYTQEVTGTFQDQDSITFTADMLSVTNPVVVTVPDQEKGVYVKVDVRERDVSDFTGEPCFLSLDLLALRLNITSVPDTQRALQVTSLFGLTRITLDFSTSCTPPYFLSQGGCEKFCEGRDDSLGHYTCTAEGDKMCVTGWLDTTTGCTTRDQSCHITQCANGGTCLDTGTCACHLGYQGSHCFEDVDECTTPVCTGEGLKCENTPGSYICLTQTDRGSGPPPENQNSSLLWFLKNKLLVIGLIVGFIVIVIAIILTFILYRKRQEMEVGLAPGRTAMDRRMQRPKRQHQDVATVSESYTDIHSQGNRDIHPRYEHLRHPYQSLRYQKPPSGTYLKPTMSKATSNKFDKTSYEIVD